MTKKKKNQIYVFLRGGKGVNLFLIQFLYVKMRKFLNMWLFNNPKFLFFS
ncbi:hypothetical protein RB653_008441 [Dictyostelium firmibasis]|uniref:Uncharacterized protein n=1 Tax=Dictyostelium firmibasis TaxID=79012 RepID=A0AAN7U037_9MYCE